MNNGKYLEYMKNNHISVLKNREMYEFVLIEDEFKDYKLYNFIERLIEKFSLIYLHYNKSDELVYQGNVKDEYVEAMMFDLRQSMEDLFYSIKRSNTSETSRTEKSIIFAGIKYIVSIYINLPYIMADYYKDEIFEYATKNNIL